MSALLEVQGLSRHYGALRAVDAVSFTLKAGELRALIGPNGAGKTTLFKLLMGEVRPTSRPRSWRIAAGSSRSPPTPSGSTATRRWRCSRRWAWPIRPTAPPRSWPTAI